MACPPTRIVELLVLTSFAAILESLYPTTGIDYALLTRVKRMARTRDIQVHDRILVAVFPGDRLGSLYSRAAQYSEVRAYVPENHRTILLRMYALLHSNLRLLFI